MLNTVGAENSLVLKAKGAIAILYYREFPLNQKVISSSLIALRRREIRNGTAHGISTPPEFAHCDQAGSFSEEHFPPDDINLATVAVTLSLW